MWPSRCFDDQTSWAAFGRRPDRMLPLVARTYVCAGNTLRAIVSSAVIQCVGTLRTALSSK